MEEKPPWELEALTFLGKKMEKMKKGVRFGFEVWEVKMFWFQTPNGGIYRVGKLGHELGCERTRLPLKFGQKTHNWSPMRWYGAGRQAHDQRHTSGPKTLVLALVWALVVRRMSFFFSFQLFSIAHRYENGHNFLQKHRNRDP